MAKGFKVPSFSMPKMDSVKNSLHDFKMPDIPGLDSSQFQDVASIMKDAGMPTTLNDLKQELVSRKENFKMPTVSDLKDMAKNKVGDIVDTAKNVKANGIKGLIPQEVMDMKDSMEEIGISPTDMLKEYGIGENIFKKD